MAASSKDKASFHRITIELTDVQLWKFSNNLRAYPNLLLSTGNEEKPRQFIISCSPKSVNEELTEQLKKYLYARLDSVESLAADIASTENSNVNDNFNIELKAAEIGIPKIDQFQYYQSEEFRDKLIAHFQTARNKSINTLVSLSE